MQSRTLSQKHSRFVKLIPQSWRCGSACGPVIVPVFKTGGWQAILSPVGSTPTRFRHSNKHLVSFTLFS